MKKLLSLCATFLILFSLAACHAEIKHEASDNEKQKQPSIQAEVQPSNQQEKTEQTEQQTAPLKKDERMEPKATVPSKTSANKPEPVQGQLIKDVSKDALRFDVASFINEWKEKGDEYFQGKSLLITGQLDYKPDIILHEGVVGERLDVPVALVATDDKKLAFELSLETNNYLVEKLKLGDEVTFEVNHFERLDELGVDAGEGHYVTTGAARPNIVVK